MKTIKKRIPLPPKQKAGRIECKWAWRKRDESKPDWWVAWHNPADKGTSNLVLDTISKLGEELVKRGYDPCSIKFTCAKADGAAAPAPEQSNVASEGHLPAGEDATSTTGRASG